MGTMIAVVAVSVVVILLVVLTMILLPKGAAIRASLSRHMALGDLAGAVEKAQPQGHAQNVSLEVIYDEGRFRIEVVDDTKNREVVAHKRGRYEVAVSYIPAADYPSAPTFAIALERSSITDDANLNRREVQEHLERLVREALQKKGLGETDRSAADLCVAYHGVIKGQFGRLGLSSNEDQNAVEAERDSDASLLKPEDQSSEQALVLEFFDAGSGELIWRAAVQAVLTTGAPLAEEERRTREALAVLLATYPPPSRIMAGRK